MPHNFHHELTAAMAMTDDANAATIAMLRANGNSTDTCQCPTCAQERYETALEFHPQPSGYHGDCQCPRCVEWRRDMAQAMIDLTEGRLARTPPARASARYVQMPEAFLTPPAVVLDVPVRNANRPPDYPAVIADADRGDAMRYTIDPQFARQRERRGHPLPKQDLPKNWKSNEWEA